MWLPTTTHHDCPPSSLPGLPVSWWVHYFYCPLSAGNEIAKIYFLINPSNVFLLLPLAYFKGTVLLKILHPWIWPGGSIFRWLSKNPVSPPLQVLGVRFWTFPAWLGLVVFETPVTQIIYTLLLYYPKCKKMKGWTIPSRASANRFSVCCMFQLEMVILDI